MNQRVAVFAHFDPDDRVRPYVVHHLAELRRVCGRIVFVTTSRPSEADLEPVRAFAGQILLKDNAGYDFGMWKHALEHAGLGDASELVLTNSSIVGPVYPLAPVFERMSKDPCDFWGMTDNFEYRWHLQSYFLVFKERALRSEALGAFFRSVLPYRSKGPVVLSYEVGLTSFLVEQGLAPGALVPTESWATWAQRRRMDLERRWNPTLFHPTKLLSLGMPYVKLLLLRDNVGHVALEPVYRAMSEAGYDLDLIEIDRKPKTPSPGLRARARRFWGRIAIESEDVTPLTGR